MKIFLNFSNNRVLFHSTSIPERFSDMVIGGINYNVRKLLYHCNYKGEQDAVELNYVDVFLDKN